MLYLIICLLVVYFVIRSFVNRYQGFTSNKCAYSWWETLSPFNTAPISIYKHLSPDNKGAVWSIISSVIIGVLSCWLGFSVQFFVYSLTQTESSKLAHYQVVDKFRPMYMEMFDSCSYGVFAEYYKSLGHGNKGLVKLSKEDYVRIIRGDDVFKNSAEAQLLLFLSEENNWDDIVHTATKCIEMSSSIAPYLDSHDSEKLLSNNSIMLTGTHIFEALKDTVVLDSVYFVKKYSDEFVHKCIRGLASPNVNMYEIYSKAYSLYRSTVTLRNSSQDKFVERLPIMSQLLTMSIMPMMENVMLITHEFAPKPTSIKPLWISLIVLAICIFIGYMLFRIIIMRFFDKKSLEPNPRMSQSDLDKLNKELSLCRKENSQYEINMSTYAAQIKQLQNELDIATKKSERDQRTKIEIENLINCYREEISKLKEQISLMTQKEEDDLDEEEKEMSS